MFWTVIVGVDGSAHGRDAMALARRLCDPHGGMLVLACAYPYEPLFDEELVMGERSRAARLGAEGILADARAEVPDLPVECCALPSTSVARALTELAEEEGADLVVVGSTHHAQTRIGLGDVAMRLLHGSPCAVAVAPPGYRGTAQLAQVGVAYDGSPEADAALDTAYRIAGELHAGVTIYSAQPQAGGSAQDRLTEAALRAPGRLDPETCVLDGPPVEAITEAAAGVIDLLVMGSRGYGPIRRALLGSVSEGLIHAAAVPVLVTPRGAVPQKRWTPATRLAGSAI